MGDRERALLEAQVDGQAWNPLSRVLLAKALYDAGSSSFEHKLALAALYAPDRERLFAIIHGESATEEIPLTASPDGPSELEQAIRYDPTVELLALERKEEPVSYESIPFDSPAYDPEVELLKLQQERESDEAHDFLYWINHVDDEDGSPAEPQNTVDEVNELLEQFLQSKARKPLAKREFFNAQRSADASESDQSDLVSESLGQLYEKQQLWDRAADVYRKLSLQNPHRSAYFAALLNEIEEKRKTST